MLQNEREGVHAEVRLSILAQLDGRVRMVGRTGSWRRNTTSTDESPERGTMYTNAKNH